jgi:hypothetical protein
VPLPDKRIITEQEIFKIFCLEGLFAMQKKEIPDIPDPADTHGQGILPSFQGALADTIPIC